MIANVNLNIIFKNMNFAYKIVYEMIKSFENITGIIPGHILLRNTKKRVSFDFYITPHVRVHDVNKNTAVRLLFRPGSSIMEDGDWKAFLK